MTKDMRYDTPSWVLINNGTRYVVYCEKKSSFGNTAIVKTPAGYWAVVHHINAYSPMINSEMHGDWNHGHYFMEDKQKAIRYYEGVK